MKLLLFGGTFDPPHMGHMNNLRAAMAAVQPDRVVVLPAGGPPREHARATPGPGRMVVARAPALECASSDIRAGKIPPERLRELLPPPVPEIIKTCGLYPNIQGGNWQ